MGESKERDFSPENKPETSVDKENSHWDSIKKAEAKDRARKLGKAAVKGSKTK